MQRISPTFFIFSLLLILVIDAYVSDVPARLSEAPHADTTVLSDRRTTLDGTVSYHQMLLLSDDAGLVALLKEISRADGQEIVLGGQTIALAGKRAPFEFSIPYNADAIRDDRDYVVEARILSRGKAIYQVADHLLVIPEDGATVDLALARVTPWTSLELALSSGRLSRHTIAPSWQHAAWHTSYGVSQ